MVNLINIIFNKYFLAAFAFFISAIILPQTSQAQQFGVGYYGAMQGCNIKIPSEIKEVEDDIKMAEKEQSEVNKLLRDKTRESTRLKNEISKAEAVIRSVMRNETNTNIASAMIKMLSRKDNNVRYTLKDCGDGNKISPWISFCEKNSKIKNAQTAFDDVKSRHDKAQEAYNEVYGKTQDESFNNLEKSEQYKLKNDADAKYKALQEINTELKAKQDILEVAKKGDEVASEAKLWQDRVSNNENADPTVFCEDPNTVQKAFSGNADNGVIGRFQANCKESVRNLPGLYTQREQAEAEVAILKLQKKALSDEIKGYKRQKKDELEDYRERLAEGDTEADFCFSCNYPQAREVSTSDKLIGLAGIVAGGAATYFGTKYASDQNAKLGWPTSPWMAYGMGYPLIMAGIYGATMGGSAGGYGCGGGGAGGAFGYPGAYGGGGFGGGFGGGGFGGMPYGGGGGYAGMPYGGGGYGGMPYAGGMFAGGIGGAFAGGGGFAPYGGMPYGGGYGGMPYGGGGMFVGGMGGAFAGGGAMMGMPYGGGYGGMPYGGGAFAGGIGGAFAGGGAMMGMPYGGGYGGMPYGGGAFAGGIGGAFAGGGAMMGMPYGGGYGGMPYGGGAFAGGIGGAFAGGGAMMGMPYGGAYGGMPYGGGMAGGIGGAFAPFSGSGSMAGMQYQMQMMQAYQQQLSSWMAEQQRMVSDYQNRSQIIGRLQQELVRIQSQIQIISVGGSSYGGGGGVPTGNVYPVPGDPNYTPSTGGTIPSRGQ